MCCIPDRESISSDNLRPIAAAWLSCAGLESQAESHERVAWVNKAMVRTWFSTLVVAVIARSLNSADAAVCPLTGEEAPTVLTLMASPTNPATNALVVAPDCTTKEVSTSSDGELNLDGNYVRRIDSIPSKCTSVTCVLQPSLDLSRVTTLTTFTPMEATQQDLDSLVLPSSLREFFLLNPQSVDNIRNLNLPAGLNTFMVVHSTARAVAVSFKGARLPSNLKILSIRDRRMTTLDDIEFPSKLEEFQFNGNPVSSITGIKLPATLISFGCLFCSLRDVHGVKWPASLKQLKFQAITFNKFEIRQSDLSTFLNLDVFDGSTSSVTCDDPSGEIKQVGPGGKSRVCVISDSRFEELYNGQAVADQPSTTAPSPTPKTATGTTVTKKPSANATIEETDAPQRDDGSTGTLNTETQGSSDSAAPTRNVTTSPSSSNAAGSEPADVEEARRERGRNASTWTSSRDGSGDAVSTTSSVSNSTVVTVGIVIGALCVVGLVFIVYRLGRGRKKSRGGDDDSSAMYTTLNSPTTGKGSTLEPDWASLEVITDGLRNDDDLKKWRLNHKDVVIGKLVARGGHGTVFRGLYQGHPVAIKQMLRDAQRNESALDSFIDEIRLSSSLDHPNIVRFIGVTSSNIRDLSIVTEFMAGGDLHSLIHKYPSFTGEEWFHSWTPLDMRSKASMATDVAKALAYLHALSNPVIHRDLKAKNVLLDEIGNAKLTDFGISREVDVTATMTGEIGTAAWIAPEVLRGERYSEKADIYSLGVLLVELDSCSHPFENDPALSLSSTSRDPLTAVSIVQKNTQMILLVSSGQLRPSPSSTCPQHVVELIDRCLSFVPSERPSADDAIVALHQVPAKSTA